MYNSRKKPAEEVPYADTAIWSCTNDGCKGWMRDEYSFDEVPKCPQCQSPMERSVKSLPVLADTGFGYKKITKPAPKEKE